MWTAWGREEEGAWPGTTTGVEGGRGHGTGRRVERMLREGPLNRREVGHGREFMFRFKTSIMENQDRICFGNRFDRIHLGRLKDNRGGSTLGSATTSSSGVG